MATDWAGMAPAYAASFGRLCSGTVPAIIDAATVVPTGGKALDVGTGIGTVAAALDAAGFDTIGVDADEGMVGFASGAHRGSRFVEGALPSLPFVDGEFDLVVANFVVNHTLKPRAAVRELARVAKAGAVVIVAIWPAVPVSPMNGLWGDVIRDSGAVVPTGTRLPAQDDFERSRDGLGALLAEAGLADVRVDEPSWDFTISAADLWRGVEAGIANIGATYRHQDESGRRAMRGAYGARTGWGDLSLPASALVGVARAGVARSSGTEAR
ncbi:hypothetical protein GCM10027568_24240 [Humibacter soli]